MSGALTCRFCSRPLEHTFVDLGVSPLSNAFLAREDLAKPESFYPLHARVCGSCWLVQLPAVQTPHRIFSDYAYFSSWSTSWLEHAQRYAAHARSRFDLGPRSQVVEVASNDGYLLQYFQQSGVPVLGIEPAANVAVKAVERGIDTIVDFFGSRLARTVRMERGQADLVVGNNVLAHVPDLNDFVRGLGILLKPRGTITLEFPHLLRLIEGRQFDTIYHEHFSYFSLTTAVQVFALHDLEVFDVEELPTHGGSVRVYVRHADPGSPTGERVAEMLQRESRFGLMRLETYTGFGLLVQRTKRDLLAFLIDAKQRGSQVVGYGAPAKGNTLLNYCGIGTEFLEYTVDRSTHKQGMFLPGTRIPIHDPSRLAETKPDFVLILPWNLKDEIVASMAHVREWGCQFVIPIPDPQFV